MQPNKNVEEMIVEHLTEMYELGHGIGSGTLPMEYAHKRSNELVELSKKLFTSHTNTVLQGVVERVEELEDKWNKKDKKTGEVEYKGGGQCRTCMLYRDSIRPKDILSLLNDQIISNKEKK